MPKTYVAMRDKFIGKGMSSKGAKRKAARIYNSKHDEPVTRDYDEKHDSKKRKKRPVKYPAPR